MNLTSIEKEWLLLDEISFHKNIWEYVSQKGYWQDIFPAFVQYNTSYYLLKKINKNNLINDYYQKNQRITLCVSEDHWKGKVENIQSKIQIIQKECFCNIQKSYVFKAGLYVIVSQVYDNSEQLAILFLDHKNDIEYIPREEEFTKFYDQKHHLLLEHYKISFNGKISNNDFMIIPKEKYKKLFYLIPLREITTFCIVILGMYSFENNHSTKNLNEIETLKNQLLDLRKTINYKDTKEMVKKIIPYLNQLQRQEPQLQSIKKIFYAYKNKESYL